MKGLVLAGGAGSRLRPLTHTGAKQLVPVANRPILFYVIDNLVDAGIVDIGIIISPETGAEVRAALGDGSKWSNTNDGLLDFPRLNVHFTYILQEKPAGLAHAVYSARKFLDGGAFCMFLGDNLIGTKIRKAVQDFTSYQELTASIMLKEVPNPSSFGIAEIDDKGRVISLIEKPANPKSNLALVGIYFFRSIIFTAIENIKPSPRGELEITDAIGELLTMGHEVHFERVKSWWLDTGKKDDLLLANTTVLDDWLKHDIRGAVDSSSKLTGRIHLAASAKVVNSTIRGPVTIDENAQIINAHIGPYTSIGAGVTIENSRVEHSVILENSRIQNIPRLEDSLIGRRVTIHPGNAQNGSLILLVGDDSKVEFQK
jgi:glucose-1-phosphate thymidylyltransferase